MYHIEITPEELQALQKQAQLMELGQDVLHRLEWFSYYLESGESVSKTCTHFGIARSTFYRWLQRFDPRDLHTLEEQSRRPRMLRKPKITQTVIDLVRIYRMQNPFLGKGQIAELLESEHGMHVSASTVGRIITQNAFYFGNSVLHQRKRRELASAERMDEEPSPAAEPERRLMEEAEATPTNEIIAFVQASKSLLRYIWKRFRRPIIVMSIVSNLALILLFLITAAWETKTAGERASQEAQAAFTIDGHTAAPERGTPKKHPSGTEAFVIFQPLHTNTYTELSPDG